MTFLTFLYSQIFVSLPKPTGSYAGKTVLVTGSNVGLGKEAARTFASLGASKVILAVRSLEKGEAAKRDIDTTTKVGPDVVQVLQLDMASYQSVIDFAAKVERELPRLDIALLNAGIAKSKFEVLEQDEATITVNVVSTFLLTLLLLPKLKETASKYNTHPTLTITSSEVHEWAKFNERHGPSIFDNLNKKDPKLNFEERYNVSKLLEVLGVRAIAKRAPADQYPVTVNTVNPGLCHSELSREAGIVLAIFKFLFARSTEVGSRTLVHAGSQGPESHGKYLSDCKVHAYGKFVLSDEGEKASEQFWGELIARLEAIKPGVTKNL